MFWGEYYLLTDEQLEAEPNLQYCKGQRARGQSVTQLC